MVIKEVMEEDTVVASSEAPIDRPEEEVKEEDVLEEFTPRNEIEEDEEDVELDGATSQSTFVGSDYSIVKGKKRKKRKKKKKGDRSVIIKSRKSMAPEMERLDTIKEEPYVPMLQSNEELREEKEEEKVVETEKVYGVNPIFQDTI